MRRSRIMLVALAVVTGLLIGFGSPKDVWAFPITTDEKGVIEASKIKEDGSYRDGDHMVAIYPPSRGLTVTLVLDEPLDLFSMIVWVDENVTVLGDLIITGDSSNTLTIDATDTHGNGAINANSITVQGVSIHAKATGVETFSPNTIYALSDITINNGSIVAELGTDPEGDRVAIFAYEGKVTINGGTVKATAPYNGILGGSGVVINGGTVEAKATAENGYAIASDGPVTVRNAKVTAAAPEGYGINSHGLTVTDATVTAAGGTHGIFAVGAPVKISGSKTVVNAKGNAIGGAILADGGSITIEEPLGVVKPQGGGISANGRFISNTPGAKGKDDFATDVVIQEAAKTYTVTAVCDPEDAGDVSADPSTAKEGAKIALKANAKDGYEFVEWTSVDGVEFADAKSADTTFDMPKKNVTVTATFKKKKEDDSDPKDSKRPIVPRKDKSGHEDNTPAAETNPLSLILVRTKGLPYGTFAARAEQGPAAKAALTASVPAGFKEAFTFNLITNNTTEVTLKNGGFTLLIPADLQKSGRTFKLLAIDKSGKVFILPDLDNDPTTITVKFNLEGFAFDLIYKD